MATVAELTQAGFNETEIQQHIESEGQRLSQAGFAQSEINSHFDIQIEPPTQAEGLRPPTKTPDEFNLELRKFNIDLTNRRGGPTRVDGTQKGPGFLGTLQRPDGQVSTELSIGVEFDGEEQLIPSLVPTLTKQQIDHLLGGGEPTEEIVDKAVAHSKKRLSQGKSPFKEEQQFSFSDNSIQPFDPAEAPRQDETFKAGAVERGAVQVARTLGITKLLPLREAGIAGGAAVPSPDELAQTAILKKLPEITGTTAVVIGSFAAAHGIFTSIGFMQALPASAGVIAKAVETAKLFAGVEAIKQVGKLGFNKITDEDVPYEGAIGVLKSAGFGMIFSLALQGTGKAGRALWGKLKPTEQAWALKQLGLKKGATIEEINKAAGKFARKFHPDKVKGFEEDFKQIIKARDILRKPVKDIVTAKIKPAPPKLLPGAVEPAARVPIKPPAKVPPEAAVAPVAVKVEPARPAVPLEPTRARPEALPVAQIPGTKIQFDKIKAPEDTTTVQFLRDGKQVHEIQVDSAEEQTDVLEAHQAILAEKGEVVERDDEIAKEVLRGQIARARTEESKAALQARLDALEGKPPIPVEVKPEVADQDLLTERHQIKQIPQSKRTVEQIQRVEQIENELVKRNADEFPEIDISPKARNTEVKKVRDQIKGHGIYQAVIEAAEEVPDLSGSFQVDKREISDVRARFEGQAAILRKFKVSETGGRRWDQAAQEVGIESLDEFMDAVEVFVEAEQVVATGVINEIALAKALNSNDPSIELFALKHDMLKNGFTAVEINKEIVEFTSREGIDIKNISDELITLEEITDVAKKQAILRELDKTFRPPKKKAAVQPAEQAAIKRAKVKAFQTKKPQFVFERRGRFIITKKPPAKGEFLKVSPPTKGELAGTTERLRAGLTPEQEQEAKLLRQRIEIAQKKKGLTKKTFSNLKLKHTNFRTLTGKVAINKITVEQLTNLLKAVEAERPTVIGNKKVVSLKTENQIAELRKNLSELGFMNDDEFRKILAIEARSKPAKFVSAKSFITQRQGRDILNRMHDSAQRLRVTEPVRRAIEKNPEVKAEIEKIGKLPRRIKDPGRLRSMRVFYQLMGEQANQPIYDVYLDLTLESQLRSRERHLSMKLAEKLPDFAKIANDPAALQRVEDWIVSKSVLKERPRPPKDITENELRLAKLVQASFKSYETLARAGKMFEFFDNRTEMPQYFQFKQGIDKAFDVFNTRGYDALIRFLDSQDWGIVSAGYSPMESVVSKVSTHRMPDIAVGKARIRQRGITYRKQDRDILQRWYSYMRQMDQLVHIQPRIKSLVRLINDNQESFVDPRKINSAVSTYLDNLKHTNYEDGLVEEWSRRLYSQAITVRVLADPLKVFRNLAQNVSFAEDRRDFFRLLAKLAKGEKLLNNEETRYLETYVQQSSVMMTDWAFVGEDPLLFKNLTKWIQRKTLYPSSDRKNRLISFAAKIDRVKRAFAKDQSLAKKMRDARFSDMRKTEQRMALSILAVDGVDDMARFVAKVHTDNTHFLYAREERSPAEQTKFGKIALNLALFRRAALEKALTQFGKIFERGTGFGAKRRAASVFVTLLGMSTLVGVLWKRATGQRYSPYSYFSFLELNFGGLAVATIERIEDVYNSTLGLVQGAVTLDAKKTGKAFDVWVKDLTEAADFMIPFYDLGWRAIEATLGTENIDRQLGKKIRGAIDKEFKGRGLKQVDRSLIEKIQFIGVKGGPEAQKKTKKRKVGKFQFGK